MAQCISIVVFDTTGNVKKCRSMLCEKWPWIFNCLDPCHQLNLMMKDIILGSKKFPKIAAFSQVSIFLLFATIRFSNYLIRMKVMTIVSSISTYFLHSNYATHHLKEEIKKEKDQRGIQVAGVTRFSSFSIHARSISRCLYNAWPQELSSLIRLL